MKLTIDVSGITRLRESFAVFSDRRFAAGMATALTATANRVRDAERREMESVFERAKPFTLNSMYVKPASAAQLVAEVGFKGPAGDGRSAIKWLQWQIGGGPRSLTGYEKAFIRAGAMPSDMRAVPGRAARLDSFGNVRNAQLSEIYRQLSIETARPVKALKPLKSGAMPGASKQYVALPQGRGKLAPGLYLVDRRKRGAPAAVFFYVGRAVYDAARFDFFGTARQTVQAAFGAEVRVALADQLVRWQKKYGGKA